jgi:hypothetical protein
MRHDVPLTTALAALAIALATAWTPPAAAKGPEIEHPARTAPALLAATGLPAAILAGIGFVLLRRRPPRQD